MRTGDGLLVRLHPANGVLSATQLRAVAAGARAAGNGLVDVTARGNLQIRGVRPGLHPGLVVALAAMQLGDARPPGGPRPEGPQRLTLAAPLAGLDTIARLDAFALATAIEGATRDLAGLHPKLLVAVEDGGRAGLGGVEADLRLAPNATSRLVLTLAGDATGVVLPPGDPAGLVRDLLARLATGGPRRARDLTPAERMELLDGLATAQQGLLGQSGAHANLCHHRACPGDPAALLASSADTEKRRGLPIGTAGTSPAMTRSGGAEGRQGSQPTHPDLTDAPASPQAGSNLGAGLAPGLHDLGAAGMALAVELPFGRGDAALLDALAAWAEAHGDGTVRLTTTRGLVLPRLREAEALCDAARRHGLIVDPDDPRRAVAACPGAPACASGHAPVQVDAARLATVVAPGLRLHVSGCAKGCAHPGPADLTLVALPEGAYGIVPEGTAHGAPVARLPLAAILARLAACDGADRAKVFAALAKSG